jgi:uncharacterized protein (TIGR00251 family)
MKVIIKVKPNSSQEKIEKTENGYLIFVKEPPVENRANQAVIKVLAKYFKIPKSQISILSGLKSKQKVIEVKKL